VIYSSSTHEFRPTLLDHLGLSTAQRPTVGVAIPIYNEVDHVEQLLEDVLSQDYEGIQEIWFIDGGSDDGTLEFLRKTQGRDPRVKVVRNPKKTTASGLNIAFCAMRTDIVMRLDAHARYSSDVVRQSVLALQRAGAGGVGAIARLLEADTLVGKAINAAHESPFGVGVASFRKEGAGGWVDTVWNGCYWRHVFVEVGPLREDLARAEDNDFNERVRRLGYGLYLDPDIRAYYRPRQTLGALWCQYYANGVGVARALSENRRAVRLRHFAPMALLSGLALPLLLALRWPLFALLSVGLLLFYCVGLVAATVLSARSRSGPHLLVLPLALLILHWSYGCGTLRGLASLLRPKGMQEGAVTNKACKSTREN